MNEAVKHPWCSRGAGGACVFTACRSCFGGQLLATPAVGGAGSLELRLPPLLSLWAAIQEQACYNLGCMHDLGTRLRLLLRAGWPAAAAAECEGLPLPVPHPSEVLVLPCNQRIIVLQEGPRAAAQPGPGACPGARPEPGGCAGHAREGAGPTPEQLPSSPHQPPRTLSLSPRRPPRIRPETSAHLLADVVFAQDAAQARLLCG